jgi:hypothetical protein
MKTDLYARFTKRSSGSFAMKVAILCGWELLHAGTGTPESLESPLTAPPSPLLPRSPPDKGRGLLIPVCGHGFQPTTDLLTAVRMLSSEGPPLQKALDRFGPIQPASAQRGVQRPNAMCA